MIVLSGFCLRTLRIWAYWSSRETNMGYGVALHVWGDYACFTRPEMKVERVSYDVITPSAARGILEAVHWKPTIRWVVDRMHVLKPVKFENIRKNEVSKKASVKNMYLDVESNRQQRAMLMLRDVAYVIEAHFEMTEKAGDDTAAKHYDIFRRRAQKGQCFQRPALGLRELVADFDWVENIPHSKLTGSQDLGWMLYDIDFTSQHGPTPQFFRAEMVDGVIDVAAARDAGMVK